MDASEDAANDPDSVSNRAAGAPVYSPVVEPRLPQELLHLIIKNLRDDRVALRQCCLASSIFLSFAQPLLFHRVKILLTQVPHDLHPSDRRYYGLRDHEPRNLERILECYSTFPFAQYARTLFIMGESTYAFRGGDATLLQSIISILSTCQQSIPDVVTLAAPASLISSLAIRRICAPIADLARILHAFPRLEVLRFSHIYIDESSDTELGAVTSSAVTSPPCLRHLQVEHTRTFHRLLSVLFADNADVHLRSLSVDDAPVTSESVWNTILRRTGSQLEELTLVKLSDEDTLYTDLTTNTRLQRVTLRSSGYEDISFEQWALTTLRGITARRLEEVTLHWEYSEDNHTVCLLLDKELAGRSKRLSYVGLGCGPYQAATAQEFFERAFPRCFALGIVRNEGAVFWRPPPLKQLAMRDRTYPCAPG